MKLRRYHRWLVLPFGLILLWVAATGVVMQAIDIYDKGLFPAAERPALISPAHAHEHDEADEAADAANAATAKPATAKPATAKPPAATLAPGQPAAPAAAPPRRPRSKLQQLHEFILHLHSGEWFGPFGTIIQTLSGLAMTFFAVSGMWMYAQMFTARNRTPRPGNRYFW